MSTAFWTASASVSPAPTTVTQNVAVYDFTKGQTVLATVISGGNPSSGDISTASAAAVGTTFLSEASE